MIEIFQAFHVHYSEFLSIRLRLMQLNTTLILISINEYGVSVSRFQSDIFNDRKRYRNFLGDRFGLDIHHGSCHNMQYV